MGLMTLITKKLNLERYHQNRQLQAPTYERHLSARSPVRLVQTVSDSSRRSISNDLDNHSESKATEVKSSKPLPPSSHGNHKHSSRRMITTPTSYDESSRRSTSSVPSGYMKHARSSSQLTLSTPTTSFSKSSALDASSPKPVSKGKAKPLANDQRAVFKTNNGLTKGHVDLLDAQSRFFPADFRSRVKASGVRDYGEDVADRNVGANGFDLDSLQVKAFYENNATSLSPRNDQRRPHTSREKAHNKESPAQTAMKKKLSVDSALRAKSLSPPQPLAAFAAPYLSSSEVMALSRKRLSLQHSSHNNTKLSSLTIEAATTLADEKRRAMYDHEPSDDQNNMHDQSSRGNRHSLQISVSQANQFASSWSARSNEPDNGSPKRQIRGMFFSSATRASSTSGQRKTSNPDDDNDEVDDTNDGGFHRPILSPQPTSNRLSKVMTSSAFTTRAERLSAKHNLHAMQESKKSLLVPRSTSLGLSKMPYYADEAGFNIQAHWLDDGNATDEQSAPAPLVASSRVRSHSQGHDRYGTLGRTRSLTSIYSRPPGGLDVDQVPIRTSSVRHWSMSSTTPTTSSSSSATFTRPHSRQTADTSIDMSNVGLVSNRTASLSSITSANSFHRHKGMQQHDDDELKPPEFNIDNVSDDDSFVASQQGRGESDEDLLFNSGYGVDGQQLPGLEDSITAAPAPVVMPRNPRRLIIPAAPSRDFRKAYRIDSQVRELSGGLNIALSSGQMSNAVDENDYLSAEPRFPPRTRSRSRRRLSQAELETLVSPKVRNPQNELYDLDGPKTVINLEKRSPETKRLVALVESQQALDYTLAGETLPSSPSSHSLRHRPFPHHNQHLYHGGSSIGDEVIEEENLDKVDIATAVRLRKEIKARKRASMLSTTPVLPDSARGRSRIRPASQEPASCGLRPGDVELASPGENNENSSRNVAKAGDVSEAGQPPPDKRKPATTVVYRSPSTIDRLVHVKT